MATTEGGEVDQARLVELARECCAAHVKANQAKEHFKEMRELMGSCDALLRAAMLQHDVDELVIDNFKVKVLPVDEKKIEEEVRNRLVKQAEKLNKDGEKPSKKRARTTNELLGAAYTTHKEVVPTSVSVEIDDEFTKLNKENFEEEVASRTASICQRRAKDVRIEMEQDEDEDEAAPGENAEEGEIVET